MHRTCMAITLHRSALPRPRVFASLKPLGAWVADLSARVEFFRAWGETGAPSAFWLSAFTAPHAFLTGRPRVHPVSPSCTLARELWRGKGRNNKVGQ